MRDFNEAPEGATHYIHLIRGVLWLFTDEDGALYYLKGRDPVRTCLRNNQLGVHEIPKSK